MKIIDKIVTSKVPPQQLNVLWHNNNTNEFKIWGNKGWELVGGNPNASSEGYPVVTVEKDFNIEAQPNIFYNFKNDENSNINIKFKDEDYYAAGNNGKKVWIFRKDDTDGINAIFNTIFESGGFKLDNSKEGYKYMGKVEYPPAVMCIYLSELPSSDLSGPGSIIAYSSEVYMNNTLYEEDSAKLDNLYILNDNTDYIVKVTLEDGTICTGVVTEEIKNNTDLQGHSYDFYIAYNNETIKCNLITNAEYILATQAHIIGLSDSAIECTIEVEFNKNTPVQKCANEFIFNINSPANIVMDKNIYWNNDNTPDFTKSGIYTLSILNGVGCYTFV